MTTTATPSELSPAEAAALLRAALQAITAEIGALNQAQLSWRPAADTWCISEIVGHLIEAEQRGFAGRIRTILAHENPSLLTWDQPQVARARGDCERDGGGLLAEFQRIRTDSIQLVESLRDDQLDRTGQHPAVGALRVRDLLHEWVFHDRAHIKQLHDNVRALVWPWMGNSRRFSQPDVDSILAESAKEHEETRKV